MKSYALDLTAVRAMHVRSGMNDRNEHSGLNAITKTLIVVAIIGALNWGLVGFFNYNLVDAIFGGGAVEETSSASRIVYAIVGVAGLLAAMLLPKLHATDVRHHRPVRGAV